MATKGNTVNKVIETRRNTKPSMEWVHYDYRGIHIKSFFHKPFGTFWTIEELDYNVRIKVASLDDAIARINAHFDN